nr:immunoglobulin heavy chain junction region [Macaca mulatta]
CARWHHGSFDLW